jgi:hypothetical protein
MSERTHFWIRLVGFAVILSLQFGPRVWTACTGQPPAPMAAAVMTPQSASIAHK